MEIEYTPQQEKKIAGYIGIAQKAGKIAAGDAAALAAIEKGKVFLAIIAADAATTVRQGIEDAATGKNVPIIFWRDKIDLGYIIGKSRRGAIAVLDQGLAAAILKIV